MRQLSLAPILLMAMLAGCGQQQETATPQQAAAPAETAPSTAAPPMTEPAVATTPTTVQKAIDPAEQKAPAAPAAPSTATNQNQVSAADIAAGKAKYGSFCAGCHGPKAEGIANYPKLTGQGAAVITTKLETFRAGQKIGPMSGSMIPIARMLTEAEVKQVAAYLGSL